MIQLGNLEETVLLLVMIMDDDAYGYSVSKEYQKQNEKPISISAMHTVLGRLEKKGFISSEMGGATEDRGGRRKRIFRITESGIKAVQELKSHRTKLWDQLPQLQ